MQSKKMRKFAAGFATICLMISLCVPVSAAEKRISFTFSRNDVSFARKSNNTPSKHTAKVTPSYGAAEGYSVSYARTHAGDGTKLAKPDNAVAAPSQSGTYKAIIEFEKDAGYVCENGTLSQEYEQALMIRMIHQTAPELRSSCTALIDSADKTGGTMAVGEQGVLGTFWSSGVKPVYSWSAGANEVVQMEEGKPARFTAKVVGTATLTAYLPADNNHYASEEAHYTVIVTEAGAVGGGYKLVGNKLQNGDWYASDVEVVVNGGHSGIVVTGPNPVIEDGITSLGVQIKAVDGSLSKDEQITVKKDTISPTIGAVTINDTTYKNTPLGERAWAAAKSFDIKAELADETSGIGKVEFSIDGGKYYTDDSAAFATEGTKTFTYAHTITGAGIQTLTLRVTDFAGNAATQSINIASPSTPVVASSSQASNGVIEPTQSMQNVKERVDYLIKSNIEAEVAGDVRANAVYIDETLTMYKALSEEERRSLGDETLDLLRRYFTMLFIQTGRSTEDLLPLFTFAGASSAPSSPSSAASRGASSAPAPISEAKPSASAEVSHEESIPLDKEAQKAKDAEDVAKLLKQLLPAAIPVTVLGIALIVYFVWKKRLIDRSEQEADAGEDELDQMERLLKHDTYDSDEYDDFDDRDDM